MANKITCLFFLVSLLSACFSTDFQPPVGLLATSIKAPLITKLPEKKLLVEKKEDYLTRFFWIPMVVPAISATTTIQTNKNVYVDYEYQSYLFGLLQKVSIVTYE